MLNTIHWCEIPTLDIDRAVRFYESVLGETLVREAFDGEERARFRSGVAGALVRRDGFVPSEGGALVYIDASHDLDGCVARATSAGGRVVVPKTDIGAMGHVAIIADSEGNPVALCAPWTEES